MKALITVNSFSPNADTLHCFTGILFQMIMNVENGSCCQWTVLIKSVRSMADIMGLLMVARRSWIFSGCGRMKPGGEAVALLEGQLHLSLPEVASGKKKRHVPHSISKALKLGAQASAGGLGESHGVTVGMALLPQPPPTGQGASGQQVLKRSSQIFSSTAPHWVSNERRMI